ncbi:MAG: hypothetical protein IT173_17270 [Acidobacteria bacterium]|nr:hypothetical protein [Acidobacteriota bacterium]
MTETDEKHSTVDEMKEKIGGLGQKIIGEIESLAGVVNADPLAQAEGEFNIAVGDIREEIEGNLEDADSHREAAGERSDTK